MAGFRALGVAAVLLTASLAGTSARQPLGPEEIRARLHAYLSVYEEELRTVVAEERMLQWPMREAGSTYLGATGGTVRRKGPSLEDLLKATSDDARERAMVLLLESARHNLGAPRTINLPSLPLELLHQRNQARYVIETTSSDRVGDCQASRLDLAETARPTIIQRPEGGDMPTHVSAWVEPDSGRLCKAEVRIRDGRVGVPAFTAVVTVEFERIANLGLTVPVRMQELFFVPQRSSGEGEATYSNYRRFTTAGRLVPGRD